MDIPSSNPFPTFNQDSDLTTSAPRPFMPSILSYDIPKRLFDIAFGVLLLPILLPILGSIALITKLTSRGSIFFAHQRIGKGGKPFYCYKFRTMFTDAAARFNELMKDPQKRAEWEKDFKLKDDPRITPIGKFLRKSSLDELPQIFNVLWGTMSFVGPRPIVQAEIEKYGDKFEFYQRSKPGITGLWQVSGRNDTNYEERVELDKQYCFKRSFWFDFKVLCKTIPVILFGKGAY